LDTKLTLNVDEAAKLLGLNWVTVYKLAKRDDFPAVQVGRRVLIPKKGLEQWLEKESLKEKDRGRYGYT
jgi:excisionase family DNA binding protein